MAYSSKYYDPAKAHEYYEKHKHLKNKTSTADLNDSGKNADKMVREALMAEKKEYNKKINDIAKEKIKAIREELKNKIADMRKDLKEKLKGMSKEEKAKTREEIKAQIGSMREEYKGKTAGVRDLAKTAKDQAKEHYQKTYEAELNKLKGDASMKKVKKKKKK